MAETGFRTYNHARPHGPWPPLADEARILVKNTGRRSTRPLRTTLADVARAAGVSINTASRAFRSPKTVRPELRLQIEEAATALHYLPNRLAGGLAGAHTGIVGVVVTSLFYSEFGETLETMQGELEAAGLHVMLGNSRYDRNEELRLVRAMLSWRPAGIGLVGVDHHPGIRELLKREQVPVVEFWDVCDDCFDCSVGMDHCRIGAIQAGHLIARDCTRIAFVGSTRNEDHRARKRLAGCMATVREQLGCELTQCTLTEGGSPELGARLARTLLESHPEIDGIACNSDVVAFGVLRTLREMGLRVPNDVKVIGFGDRAAATCMNPSLSTVIPPRSAIGEEAARMLLRRIDGGKPAIRTFDAELAARGSTGGP
ncbi:MAG: LacI family DNA-binding transcriptional regulator [Geminicoccaceae bacterium]